MARNDELARDRPREKSLLDRRSYLKLAGAAAASLTAFGTQSVAAQDGNVLLREDFEDSDYDQWFSSAWDQGEEDYITDEEAHGGNSSLRIDVPEGDHRGVKANVDPQEAGLTEENVQQLYASYWIKFDPEFETDSNGGKLPGPRMREPDHSAGSGTDGTNGWSAVGKFGAADNGEIQLGYYCYHMDQSGGYGDHIHAGTVSRGEWHHIEQYVELNSVDGDEANADGTLAMWVDGQQTLNRTDMRWTITNHDRGINFDMLVYYGGNQTSPRDNHLYIDDWTLATTRVTDGQGREEEQEGTVLDLVSADDSQQVEYEFTVDGAVQKRLNAGDLAAEDNDSITENDDGTVTVSGISGNGNGDSYYVDGSVESMSLDESVWTLRYDGEEVAVDDLVDAGGPALDRFEIAKSERLGENRMFSVQWAVSASETELDTVEVVTVETADDLNFAVTDVAGANASGWDLFQFPAGTELDVSLRATDADENVTKETKTVTL